MRKDCVGHQASFLMWRKTRSLLWRLPGTGVIMGRHNEVNWLKTLIHGIMSIVRESKTGQGCRSWLKECENFSPPCRKFRFDCWAIRVKHLVWTSHGWWTFQMSDCQPGNHALQRSVLECALGAFRLTGLGHHVSLSRYEGEWWWRPTSEFVNFSCSELLIYPYLAWNDVFIPIYVLNELL